MTALAVTTGTRLGRFVSSRFTPPVYVTYGVLWVLAFESSAEVLSGPHGWVPTGGTVVRVSTVVLVLLFMRMLDEQKDLDYDRLHNPDRPLVTGAITVTELRLSMAVIGVIVLALNAALSAVSLALVALDLAYGLGLAALERVSARARDGMLVNLALAYPVQVLLSCYLYGSLASTGALAAGPSLMPLLLVFAGVFLQFEFARKTSWDNPSDARLYSTVLGPVGSALAAVGLALGACAVAVALFWSQSALGWLPAVLVVCPAAGAALFFGRRRSAGLLGPAMCFVLGFLVSLVLVGLVGPAAKGW